MKKLITLALIVGATTLTQAQSNLVFNQVLNFSISPSVSATVPEGKVWKVEHSNYGTLKVSKADVAYGAPLIEFPFNSTSANNNAIWFSEGAVLKTEGAASSLSILEFNVEPISTTTGGSGGGVSADGFTASGVFNLEFTPLSGATQASLSQIGSFSVPEGKIWKIINASTYGTSNLSLSGRLIINGNIYNSSNTSGSGANSPWNLFLSAGTYEIEALASGSGSLNRFAINGIEYNAN